jgi:hypothetical protein
LPNSNLKNIISTYTKDFSWKNDPNSPGLEKKKSNHPNHQIFLISSNRVGWPKFIE